MASGEMIGFVGGGIALFKAAFDIMVAWQRRDPKTGVPWLEIAGSLAMTTAGAVLFIGLFVLIERSDAPRPSPREHEAVEPPPACSHLDLRLSKYPRCAEHTYRDTNGTCEYHAGVIGAGTWSTDRDLEFYCARLSLGYDPEP
jgi:hypothetical protein